MIDGLKSDLITSVAGKQDKLIAGNGITIASDGKTISAETEKPWIFMPKNEVLAMEFFDITTTGAGNNKKVTSLTLKKDLKIKYSRFKTATNSDHHLVQSGEFYLYKKSISNNVIINGVEKYSNSKYLMYSVGNYDTYLWYADNPHSSSENNSICIGYSDNGKFIALNYSSYNYIKDNTANNLSDILAENEDDNSWKYSTHSTSNYVNIKFYYR